MVVSIRISCDYRQSNVCVARPDVFLQAWARRPVGNPTVGNKGQYSVQLRF